MAFLPPDAESGETNLTCPNCGERIGVIQLMRNVPPETISPNTYTICPNRQCQAWFFPENALLQTLRDNHSSEGSFFRWPLSLGGHFGTNITWTKVGETREHQVNNLYHPYEIETVYLRGAERENVDSDNRLPIELIDDSYTRATLGDAVLVAVTVIGPQDVVVTANLREDREMSHGIEAGDEIRVLYEEGYVLREVLNPSWINLLRGATEAIRRDNLTAALPLLVSALDNGLYRQTYLYHRLEGNNHQEAHNIVIDAYGNNRGNVYRKNFAVDALEDISGIRLTNGPLHREWQRFQEEILDTRNTVVHSTESHIEPVDRATVVEWFDTIIDLLVGMFDHMWFHNS